MTDRQPQPDNISPAFGCNRICGLCQWATVQRQPSGFIRVETDGRAIGACWQARPVPANNICRCVVPLCALCIAGLIFVAYCVVCYLVTALLFSLLILDLAALVITISPSKAIFKYTDLVYTGDWQAPRACLVVAPCVLLILIGRGCMLAWFTWLACLHLVCCLCLSFTWLAHPAAGDHC